MLDWIEGESFWLGSPAFADELVGREATEGLQSASEIVGGDEISATRFELAMIVVVEALDGRLLDRTVHPLDLPIGSRDASLWSGGARCRSRDNAYRTCASYSAPSNIESKTSVPARAMDSGSHRGTKLGMCHHRPNSISMV